MKKKKKYKAAVIGCGKIGVEERNYIKEVQPATHAKAYQNHPQIELAALVDIKPERLKVVARYFPNVPLFKDTKKMLKEIKPDIVSIATLPNSHFELVKLVAKSGTKAIVCEKPIALSLKKAEAMIKFCQDPKSLLFIDHQRRFDPLIREWQSKVKKGLIGKIFQGTAYYYNGLFNNGTHIVDLLRFFLGEIDWVRGVINLETSTFKDDKNVDGLIHFKNGTRVALQSLPQNYGFSNLYFYGNQGRIALKNLGYEIEYSKLIKNRYYKSYYQLSEVPERMGKVRSFMRGMAEHVVSCLDGLENPVSTGEDGFAALKVLFALKKSAENNAKLIRIRR
jgi:predicted dehydrogenase